ncbi:MAG: alkaline phosphatase family protein [Verrucomicrobia bacterium]|nr:alkaline phosphatase family protein [Verrucomicrobiota bacterium]
MRKFILSGLLAFTSAVVQPGWAAGHASHVIIVVWDGMRPDFVTERFTPTLYRLARTGVTFANHHSVYPCATEVNGTAISTGAYPLNSGIMANAEYRPGINNLKGIDTQATNSIRKGDELAGGHYLARATLAEILQNAGRKTAVAGSKQVAILHDRALRADDFPNGINVHEGKAIPASALDALTNALGAFPESPKAGALKPNEARDTWTTRALLEHLWSNSVPDFTILWLSEPDFSQHDTGPGSETSLAGLKSSDDKLTRVLRELERRKLRDQTDIFIVSDHGFSTVARAVDLEVDLKNAGFHALREYKAPPKPDDIIIVGQGGSVLFYVTGHDADLIAKLVDFLQGQDYAGVIFTQERMSGTFALRDANIATEEAPDVVLSLRWSANKSKTGTPGIFCNDGTRKPGEGSHASLSRFDVHNTLIATGPDFRDGFVNQLPSANTDLAPTILWILGIQPPAPMDGRVLSEALTIPGPKVSRPKSHRLQASRMHDDFVWHQYLQTTTVNTTLYLDEGNGYQTPKP